MLLSSPIELPTTYDPASNDIQVTVYQKGNKNLSYDVNFPATGSIPCIIAIDPVADWAVEKEPFNYGLYVNPEN